MGLTLLGCELIVLGDAISAAGRGDIVEVVLDVVLAVAVFALWADWKEAE